MIDCEPGAFTTDEMYKATVFSVIGNLEEYVNIEVILSSPINVLLGDCYEA